jgi:aspartyl-tRNA(Asn)/glutamyl-tRNA(Gln) amidotransferase subunit A
MTIQEAAESLRTRRVSSEELTNTAIRAAERDNLNCFITLTAEHALRRAREADRELASGRDRGPLHGVPVAVKDLFATRGVRTTGGSKIYAEHVTDYDSTVVARLEAAGAVILGKLNLHELAYGITSNNPHFGPVRNPWNPEHSPGGSSGGSGASVATGIVFAAMGTDTGGSIRIPASFCGTVGLKPTYGRVSRFGVMPLAYSMDHMGPLTLTVRDTGIVMNAIVGHDDRDETSSRRAAQGLVPEAGCSIRGVRIGLPSNFYFEALDPDVESAVRGAVARAESLGAIVKPIAVPDIAAINAVARIVLLSEASAVWEPHLGKRDQFGADVLALLDQGRLVPATDYVNAQRIRRRMRAEFDSLWNEIDCLITPATPCPAPRIGQTIVNLGGREEDVRLAVTRFARAVNFLGLPALSIPCGLTSQRLPIGIQMIGPAFAEASLLRIGAALEDAGVGIPGCSVAG